MKHLGLNFRRTVGLFFLTIWGIVIIGITDASALIFDTGSQNPSAETIKKDPYAFLDYLKRELRLGHVGNIILQAEQLSKALPENPDVQSLVAIAYASKGDNSHLQTVLSKIEANQVKLGPLALCAEAMILRLQKQYDLALSRAQQAISLDPSHPYLWNVLGRVFFDLEEYSKAIESFQKSISLEPDFLPGYTNLGNSFLLQGDLGNAEKSFAKAIVLDSNNAIAHQGLSLVFEKKGQFNLALQHLSQSSVEGAEDAAILRRIAYLQLKTRQYVDAISSGQKMKSQNIVGAYVILADASLHLGRIQDTLSYCSKQESENRPELAYICGVANMVAGDYGKALVLMEEVLDTDKSHFGAYAARAVLQSFLDKKVELDSTSSLWNKELNLLLTYFDGNLSFSKGHVADALTKWKLAEKMIPGFSTFGIEEKDLASGLLKDEVKFLNLGVLYFLKGLFEEAQEEFDIASAKNPDSIFANYWIAQVHLENGDKKLAIAAYEKAIQNSPDFFVSLYAIGELNFQTGRLDQAAIFYKRALSVKQDAGIMIKLGIYFERQGVVDEAAKYYNMAIEAYPEFFIGYNQLAWLYAKQGVNLNEAMQLAINADKLQPGNASILDTMGWIFFHQENYTLALEKTEQSLEVNPDIPTVLYHLARIQVATGNREEAKKNLQAALAVQVLFDEIEEVKVLLKDL